MVLTDDQKLDFDRIAGEIGEWAKTNFGDNEAKPEWLKRICKGMKLGPIGPLLGIGEEIGEMTTAIFKHDQAEIEDGFADILIFSADFCMRFNLSYSWIVRDALKNGPRIAAGPENSLQSVYGRLLHACLKSVQGIRGYEVADYAHGAIHTELSLLLYLVAVTGCNAMGQPCNAESILNQLRLVWESVVKKRNWKKPDTVSVKGVQ